MWCEKLKNGKYRFAERYMDPLTGNLKRISVTMEKNTRQAQKLAQETLHKKIQAKMLPQDKELLFSELVTLYLKEQKTTVKKSTWKRNYFSCQTLLKILGANTLTNKLTAGYIRQQLLVTGKKNGTLNEHMKRLKALLRWGYKNDYIADISYLDKLERFPDMPHRQKIENKFLESTEVNDLLGSLNEKRWHDLTKFLVLSGLRFGEAAALLHSDIDIKNRIIKVSKTYDGINDVVTSPKTRTSNREVYMQDELLDLYKNVLSSNKNINTNILLFSNNEKHISFDIYAKYLRENSEKAIGRRITSHTLRHTHASLMLENGLDVDAISARLGHSNSKITREIYLHVTKKLKEKQDDQIREIRIFAP